tara:strand:+ start:199 stop:426 length:228 start_codon:yes stop_codon:yes gene_type:complete
MDTSPQCSDQGQVISEKGMPDRKLLPLAFQTATLTFEEFNLGNEPILKGGQRILAGLFERCYLASRRLKLIVAVP